MNIFVFCVIALVALSVAFKVRRGSFFWWNKSKLSFPRFSGQVGCGDHAAIAASV